MDVLSDIRDQVGESPLWSPAEQALWWVDIEGRALRRYDWATRQVRSWPTAERPACIALHAEGGFIAGMDSGLFHLRPQDDGTLTAERLAEVEHARDDMRFNDGRCDRAGRFWAGTMVRDMSLAANAGVLYRQDRATHRMLGGFITPNGLGFSPDGATLYVSDSHPAVQRVWRFDLHDDGSLGPRHEFVDMNLHPGRPDGGAVDSEGCYWICANDAGLVHRFTPDGRLERSLPVPVDKPAMCSFGGPDLGTLFVTSIRPAQPPPGQEALAGALFATRPGATGIAETPFHPFQP